MANRLDKDLFSEGFSNIQSRIEKRLYVNALSFTQDLGEVINKGIISPPQFLETPSQHGDNLDAFSVKPTFADIRERRKLGKRILKAAQPFLESALRVESEISNKPFETLQKELDAIIDCSIDIERQPSATGQSRQDDGSEDTIMVDAQVPSHINVKYTNGGEREDGVDAQGVVKRSQEGEDDDDGNIEVSTVGLGIVSVKHTRGVGMAHDTDSKSMLPDGIDVSVTPPDSNGYISMHASQAGPPTPPQSNGSLGKDMTDSLADGGILWYLKMFQPQGTSIVDDHWAAGRDAVRMLSEDLTDLDDEEMKGLVMDVDEAAVAASLEVDDIKENMNTNSKSKASKVKKRRTSGRRR